jgi:hypothetical protein
MQAKTTSTRPLQEVTRWRCRQLMQSGFALTLAARVARNARYDLHALIELVEQGCEPELAVRILAPIEDESAA